MKKNILFLSAFLLLAGATSCNDWLDVKPETSVDESDLFADEQGFKDALAGVYADMASSSLYGQTTTFGFIDVLGQIYDYDNLESVYHDYHYDRDYNYSNAVVKSRINSIWRNMYTTIAEINNILKWDEETGDVMNAETRKQIKGQCYVLRAYLHYDLLRMFAADVKLSGSAQGIPYVTEFGVKPTKFMSVQQVIDAAKADLQAAKTELANDPIKDVVPYELDDKEAADMYVAKASYYTAEALLARILLDEGKYSEAQTAAQNVIASGKYRLLDVNTSINVNNDKLDVLFNDEHILSLRNQKIPSYAKQLHLGITSGGSTTAAALPLAANISEIYDNNNDDARLMTWVQPSSALMVKYTRDDITKFYPKQVLIKLSEMYLISAEAKLNQGNEDGALEDLNTLRASRIATDSYAKTQISTDEIIAEMRREFIGEGQLFFQYKRLNSPILKLNKNIEPSSNIFVFPIPDGELEYGSF